MVWNILLFFHILGLIIPADVHILGVWNRQPVAGRGAEWWRQGGTAYLTQCHSCLDRQSSHGIPESPRFFTSKNRWELWMFMVLTGIYSRESYCSISIPLSWVMASAFFCQKLQGVELYTTGFVFSWPQSQTSLAWKTDPRPFQNHATIGLRENLLVWT